MDPSWIIQVVDLHLGTLAEVTVAWAPRGSGEVEYLLSWVEESGFVSGHLLTDQVTSELSLWPGQGYHLQVCCLISVFFSIEVTKLGHFILNYHQWQSYLSLYPLIDFSSLKPIHKSP